MLVRCLNLRTKRIKRTVAIDTVRFMCYLRPPMKIRATVLIQLIKNTRFSAYRTILRRKILITCIAILPCEWRHVNRFPIRYIKINLTK